MRYLILYLLALFFVIFALVMANAQSQNNYTIWGNSDGSLPEIWFEEETEDESILGYIVHYNQWSSADDTEIFNLSSSQGTVTIHLDRTFNGDCEEGCPDTLEVYDLPEGYVAVPSFHSLAEKAIGRITIYKYQGV